VGEANIEYKIGSKGELRVTVGCVGGYRVTVVVQGRVLSDSLGVWEGVG
jgi:hypothetical protein